MLRGEWGEEEREGKMVLKHGSEFTIDIYCQDEKFEVCDMLIVVVVILIVIVVIIMNF